MMDLRTLRSEIYKLSEMVGEWSSPERIPKIERDLVLEKLRALYDAVRFAVLEPEHDVTAKESVAVVEPEPEVVSEPEPEVVSEPESEVVSEPEPEVVAEAEPEVVSEAEPEVVAEVAVEPMVVAVAEPEPIFVVEVVTESKPVSEPESEPEQALESEPVSAPEPISEPESEPIAELEPAKQPEAVVEVNVSVSTQTLFGLDTDESEAEKLRHRHKQRVIMSLYGSEPERPAVEPLRRERPVFEAESMVDEPLRQERPAFEVERPAVEPEVVADGYRSSTVDFEIEEEREVTTIDPVKYPAEEEPLEEEDFVFEEISLTQNTVLGDVIKPEGQTLADTLRPLRNMASEIRRQESVADLRQAIGLNDKFLLIRDLFGGDAAACDQTLEILNSFDNLDDCMIHIAENYLWNPNSDGAKFMMELLERKFA